MWDSDVDNDSEQQNNLAGNLRDEPVHPLEGYADESHYDLRPLIIESSDSSGETQANSDNSDRDSDTGNLSESQQLVPSSPEPRRVPPMHLVRVLNDLPGTSQNQYTDIWKVEQRCQLQGGPEAKRLKLTQIEKDAQRDLEKMKMGIVQTFERNLEEILLKTKNQLLDLIRESNLILFNNSRGEEFQFEEKSDEDDHGDNHGGQSSWSMSPYGPSEYSPGELNPSLNDIELFDPIDNEEIGHERSRTSSEYTPDHLSPSLNDFQPSDPIIDDEQEE